MVKQYSYSQYAVEGVEIVIYSKVLIFTKEITRMDTVLVIAAFILIIVLIYLLKVVIIQLL